MPPIDERIVDRAAALYVKIPSCRLISRTLTDQGQVVSASTLARKLRARGVLRSRGEAAQAYRESFGDPRERGAERRNNEFKALDLFRRGTAIREISRRLLVPYTTVHFWVERSGLLRRRKHRKTPAKLRRLADLRHLSAEQAGVALGGVPKNTIRRWRTENPHLQRVRRPEEGRSEPET